MRALQTTLMALGAIIIIVALLHIILGPGADVLIGANFSETSLSDPTIDSQNRFYGAAFALFGVALIVCSSDIVRYRPILLWTFLIFFLAGMARLISAAKLGWPAPMVVALLALELVVPPVLALWVRREITQ